MSARARQNEIGVGAGVEAVVPGKAVRIRTPAPTHLVPPTMPPKDAPTPPPPPTKRSNVGRRRRGE